MRIKLNMFFILFLFLCYYTGFLMQAIVMFISVMLHELGHVYTARLLKLKVEEVELFPFGGVARMEDITKYGGLTEALVAIAGPLTSLLLAMICYILALFSDFFKLCMQYNTLLFLFNMIPVLPLDGGRVLRNILLHYTGYKAATKSMVLCGRLFAILLVVYNILMICAGDKSAAYAFLAIFVYIGTVREMKFCSYYYLLHKNNQKLRLIRKNAIKKRMVKVHKDTYIRFAASHFSPSSLCEVQVISEQGKVLRLLNEADIMEGMIKYGYDGKIYQLLKDNERP